MSSVPSAASGEIHSETIPALLRRFHQSSATGSVLLQQGAVAKTLRLHRGSVVFASSNQRDDRLNDFLVCRAVWGLLAVGALMKA
jgi:hypothetical protein